MRMLCTRERKPKTLSRYHLRLRNIHPGAVEAADRLFAAKPWLLEDTTEQERIVQQFLDTVSDVYGVESPEFKIDVTEQVSFDLRNFRPSTDFYGNPLGEPEGRAVIIERYLSLTNMMFAFRSYVNEKQPDKRVNPFSWACSLFYAVRPCQFRRKARQGRIQGVSPRDTYTTETWERMQLAGIVDVWGNLNGRDNWPTVEELNALPDAPTVVEEAAQVLADANDGLDDLGTTELRRLASRHQIPGAWSNRVEVNRAELRRRGVTSDDAATRS